MRSELGRRDSLTFSHTQSGRHINLRLYENMEHLRTSLCVQTSASNFIKTTLDNVGTGITITPLSKKYYRGSPALPKFFPYEE